MRRLSVRSTDVENSFVYVLMTSLALKNPSCIKKSYVPCEIFVLKIELDLQFSMQFWSSKMLLVSAR